jgi:hypothetical protein
MKKGNGKKVTKDTKTNTKINSSKEEPEVIFIVPHQIYYDKLIRKKIDDETTKNHGITVYNSIQKLSTEERGMIKKGKLVCIELRIHEGRVRKKVLRIA